MKLEFLFYNKPTFYFCNSIFLMVRLVANIFYYIFIHPFKLIANFYKFMIQINIFLKIEKILKKKFELDFTNIALEISYLGPEINEMVKSFNWYQNSKNKIDIKGNMSGYEYNFEYSYRGIILNLSRKGKYYYIKLWMNNKMLINCKKVGPCRWTRFEPSFL